MNIWLTGAVKYYSVAASAELDAVLSSTLFLHFTDVICLLFTQTELKGTVDVISITLPFKVACSFYSGTL